MFSYTGTGGVSLSGAADLAKTKAYAASGGPALAGAAGIARTWAPVPSGIIALGGQAGIALAWAYTSEGHYHMEGAAAASFESAMGQSTGGTLETPRDKRRKLIRKQDEEILALVGAGGY